LFSPIPSFQLMKEKKIKASMKDDHSIE